MKEITPAICERLACVRRDHYGSRGRSRFAGDLGIRPSTYAHYESDRLPPADILLRAARLTGTRLEWLITGEGEPTQPQPHTANAYGDLLAERLRNLLRVRPECVPQVEAFLNALDLLKQPRPSDRSGPKLARPSATELIPIIGSTSAGTARYWHERPESHEGPIADARLEQLIAACTGPTREAPAHFGSTADGGPVSLVQLSRPDDRGLIEFLSAAPFKQQYPDCIAWRIDGESMAPRFVDGDLVITSPRHPAEGGHPCVARQREQLGVNCKLFQQDGETVWLIPINSAYPTQTVRSGDIVWAWRVLASVRLTRGEA